MFLKQLHLKNFRCFSDKHLTFEHATVLIEGLNGAGKTSLLEALHYLCYLRSFRTHSPRELVSEGQDSFFIKALFESVTNEGNQEIQVGFSGSKRLVKINQKVVGSYKQLFDYYRIVTITEDDLEFIKGGPDIRRTFIDQILLLEDPGVITILKAARHIADSRNKLLYTQGVRNRELYYILTEQLWNASRDIQRLRKTTMERLGHTAVGLLHMHVDQSLTGAIEYKPKLMESEESFDEFMKRNTQLAAQEDRFRRSLFGAHLDDITITFEHRKSRNYASRGQQKLLVILLKIAQMRELIEKKGSAIFLLDDFMTDFDEERACTIVTLLAELKTQLIFTTPAKQSFVESALKNMAPQKILLTH